MKKLLITGFEPFGGEQTNPSFEALSDFPDEINGYSVVKLQVPVVFGKAGETVIKAAEKISPDVILCIGQAGGRDAITPELVAINLRYAAIPDNSGYQPKDEPIIENGENALFSTLPVREMTAAVNAAGVPARVSYSAGAYVCNDLLYTLLDHFRGSKTRIGFIHVPYSADQKKDPSMKLGEIVRALTAAIVF